MGTASFFCGWIELGKKDTVDSRIKLLKIVL